jgi:hypothetical protein
MGACKALPCNPRGTGFLCIQYPQSANSWRFLELLKPHLSSSSFLFFTLAASRCGFLASFPVRGFSERQHEFPCELPGRLQACFEAAWQSWRSQSQRLYFHAAIIDGVLPRVPLETPQVPAAIRSHPRPDASTSAIPSAICRKITDSRGVFCLGGRTP